MKKLLSMVLAIMMIVSMTSFAFAGTFDDVDSENEVLTQAASMLNELKIVTGYEDGSFKPEKVVTRAEMAAMLIRACGYDKIANDNPSFTDCQNHWAKGYIALASDLGIINGRGNGIFDPDATVTYEEAAVMMLRSLGYTNESINNGKSDAYSAANYRTRALSLEIYKGFDMPVVKAGANRGDIAVMISNLLDLPIVRTNEDGRAEQVVLRTESEPNNIGGYTTVNVYKSLIDNVATAKELTITEANVNPDDNAFIKSAIDLTPYLYQTVVAYVDNENTDRVITVRKVKSDVVVGTVKTPNPNSLSYVANTIVVNTDKGTTKLQLAATTIDSYINNGAYDATFAADFDYNTNLYGAEVKFVLNAAGKVIGAIANEVATVGTQVEKLYKANATILGDIYLPKTNGKVDLSKVTVKGACTSIEDIKINDVVLSCPASLASGTPTETVLLVSRDTVQGTITKTNSGEYALYIDGNLYYSYSYGIATLEVGSKGTFYLDFYGDVFAFDGTAISNNEYAMVTKLEGGVYVGGALLKDAYITILNNEGKATTYYFDEDAKYTFNGTTLFDVFDNKTTEELTTFKNAVFTDALNTQKLVVGFEVNSNNEINKIKFEALTLNASVNYGSKTFAAAEDVAIFSKYTTGGKTYYEVAEVTSLPKSATICNVAYNEDGELAAIVVNSQLTSNTYAVVTGYDWIVNSNNEKVRVYTVYVDGEKMEYTAKYGSTANSMTVATHSNNNLYRVELTSEGLVSNLQVTDTLGKTGTVANYTNTTTQSAITVNAKGNNFVTSDGIRYAFDENTVVYVYNRMASRNDRWSFANVGDLTDLDLLNYDVFMYNTSTANDTNPGTSNDVLEYVILVEKATVR